MCYNVTKYISMSKNNQFGAKMVKYKQTVKYIYIILYILREHEIIKDKTIIQPKHTNHFFVII